MNVNVQDDDEGTDNDSMNDNDFDYNEEDAEDPLLGRTKVMVRIYNLFFLMIIDSFLSYIILFYYPYHFF